MLTRILSKVILSHRSKGERNNTTLLLLKKKFGKGFPMTQNTVHTYRLTSLTTRMIIFLMEKRNMNPLCFQMEKRECFRHCRFICLPPLRKIHPVISPQYLQNRRIKEQNAAYGKGGRKTARAVVIIKPGNGTVTVNKREFSDYWPLWTDRDMVLSPLVVTERIGQFDVNIRVAGGGVQGKIILCTVASI